MPDDHRPAAERCEFVSRACVHRLHDACHEFCPYCGGTCLCVCHSWMIPVGGEPVEDA